jgi:hypothetical protein
VNSFHEAPPLLCWFELQSAAAPRPLPDAENAVRNGAFADAEFYCLLTGIARGITRAKIKKNSPL